MVKPVNREQLEKAAYETADEVRKEIRNAFQDRHPKYVPPPWAGIVVWRQWYFENIRLHGADGFRERGLDQLMPEDHFLGPRLRVGQIWQDYFGARFRIVPLRSAVLKGGRLRKGFLWGYGKARGHVVRREL